MDKHDIIQKPEIYNVLRSLAPEISSPWATWRGPSEDTLSRFFTILTDRQTDNSGHKH